MGADVCKHFKESNIDFSSGGEFQDAACLLFASPNLFPRVVVLHTLQAQPASISWGELWF